MSNPDPALERCTEELNHPRVTVRANGRVATFLNPERVNIRKIDVDCWLHGVDTAKSDCVVCKAGSVDVIVELKGKDIHHAIDQIVATYAHWKRTPSRAAKTGALVVFTRSPERSATLDTVKAKLLAKHGIWLEMGKSGLKDYDFTTFAGARS